MASFNPFGRPRPAPLCGCFVVVDHEPKFLPLTRVDARVRLLASASRTRLTQAFVNGGPALDEVRYEFPLHGGVSVVGFTCTVGDGVVRGEVRERRAARTVFDEAVARGETAGLLQQHLGAADVFTAALGNVPAGATVTVDTTFLGELEHDAEADGVRFTLPTSIAPRYDGGHLVAPARASLGGEISEISVTVDAEMADGCSIRSLQSPSHPIAVSLGASSASISGPSRASASLSLRSAALDKDFVLVVAADGLGSPAAVLETHPTMPCQRALMTTLVPRFSLPAERPEVVFVCDRSGSMGDGKKMPNLVAALQVFLKSLPLGVRFNICSFGSTHSFLWDRSRLYGQDTLDQAVEHVKAFASNLGGTDMHPPLEDTFKRRRAGTNLETFLLTDGEIWNQDSLFRMVDKHVADSAGAIRVFTLGVGATASSALIQGVARAGNGFAQQVADDEKMDKKVVRMLKGALTPHVNDYALQVEYEQAGGDDDFEIIDKVIDSLTIDATESAAGEPSLSQPEPPNGPISLFDPGVEDKDLEMPTAPALDDQSNLPAVTPPRYLQAPFKIPPLFPFHRTTVYVMLSDETPRREPKAVVLTGTSPHGPLRLEIPVRKLADKGITVHQLAARKAIQELEHHRGWIAHARDGTGRLLKERFEGQFEDLVRREAVRLGVEFQVGGKWCSFVAIRVKDGKEEHVGELDVAHAKGSPTTTFMAAGPRQRVLAFGAPAMGMKLMDAPAAPACASYMASPQGGSSLGSGFSSLFGSSAGSGPTLRAHEAAFVSGGLFGSAGGRQDMSASTLFGGLPAAPQPTAPAATATDLAAPVSEGLFGPSGGRRNMSASTLFGGLPAATATVKKDPLAVLTSLQTFVGSWTWSRELEEAMGVSRAQAAALALPTGEDVAATVCAVAFLRTKLRGERDAWELMVDKAEGWLEGKTGEKAAALEKTVEGLFTG